jgi:hypothetical protein
MLRVEPTPEALFPESNGRAAKREFRRRLLSLDWARLANNPL